MTCKISYSPASKCGPPYPQSYPPQRRKGNRRKSKARGKVSKNARTQRIWRRPGTERGPQTDPWRKRDKEKNQRERQSEQKAGRECRVPREAHSHPCPGTGLNKEASLFLPATGSFSRAGELALPTHPSHGQTLPCLNSPPHSHWPESCSRSTNSLQHRLQANSQPCH